MFDKRTPIVMAAAIAAFMTVATPALAKGTGGGGGGTTTPTLATPAIAPGTFDGIGAGPVYIHDSFGHAQGTRYKQDGSIVERPVVTCQPPIRSFASSTLMTNERSK